MNKIYTCCEFLFEDMTTNRKDLFEKAFTWSKHGKVLYILQEELSELPQLSQDYNTIDRNYIRMISFLYASDLQTLLEGISSLPSWQNIPATIILDDLSEYCNKDKFQNMCGVVALLISIANGCSRILNTSCRLYISIKKGILTPSQCNTLKELYGTDKYGM